MAEYLEKCGNDGNTSEIDAKTPELLEKYRGYETLLAAFADTSAEESKEEIDPIQLQEAYVSIAEFVEGFDFDSAQNIIDMVSEYRIPEGSKDLFKQISSLVRTVNRDGLLMLLMG